MLINKKCGRFDTRHQREKSRLRNIWRSKIDKTFEKDVF